MLLSRLLPSCLLISSSAATAAMGCSSAPANSLWLERSHTQLSSYVCQQARWFDSFFAPPEESDLASSQIRLRLENGFNTAATPEYRLRLSANYHLPGPKKRWQLLLDGHESGQLEQLSDISPRGRSLQDWDFSTAIEHTWYQLRQLDITSRAGVRLSGLDPFARIQYRSQYALNSTSQLEWKEILSWRDAEHWRLRSQLNWESIEGGDGYAWRNHFTQGLGDDNVAWKSSVMKLSQLGPASALRSYVAVQGDDQHNGIHLGSHWRSSFAHSWLFYEIEPQLYWASEHDRKTQAALKLALEVQFGH